MDLVVAGYVEADEDDELATVRQRDGFVEGGGPAQCRQPSLEKPDGSRGAALSFVPFCTPGMARRHRRNGMRTVPPWPMGLVLADPCSVFAKKAFHQIASTLVTPEGSQNWPAIGLQ
jgi:hypothetical protein